jgi:vitamin B12 transporter
VIRNYSSLKQGILIFAAVNHNLRPLTAFFFIVVVLLCPRFTLAQSLQDTLREVQVSSEKAGDTTQDIRAGFTAGQQVQKISDVYREVYQMQSLAGLLSQQTPVFIKSYGINSMATLSFRGASAAQSAVLWNGVPILNPALGVADISLLSTGLFDNISLQYGSSAALYGSGNVGGALMLDRNAASFKSSRLLKATIGAGSFGRKDIQLAAQWQQKRWRADLKTFYQQTNNDFNYTNSQQQEEKLPNAHLKAGGLMASFDYNLSKNATAKDESISLDIWYQQYQREIPPALFEQFSVKRQTDASFRSLLGWQKKKDRSYFYAKASYNREYLRYQDGVVLPDNKNNVTQYYQELGWKYQLNKTVADPAFIHEILLFSPLQYTLAKGQNISSQETQFRPALVATYSFRTADDRLKANAALRQEWVNGNTAPLLPGAGALYRLFTAERNRAKVNWYVRANVQRTYRFPTLNELYYFPGGNVNLRPEQGWNEDAGYTFEYRLRKQQMNNEGTTRFLFSHDLAGFNRNIKDWIYWLGGAIWTPYNIAEVHSRGLETDNKVEYLLGNCTLHFALKSAYIISTSEASYLPNDGSKGKQIPYVPRYNGQLNLGFSLAGWFFNYNHTYTGYRFVTIDESQFLEPYNTGNVQLMYTFNKAAYTVRAAAQVQNIWDTPYEVISARPMPGRYFQFSLQFGLKG